MMMMKAQAVRVKRSRFARGCEKFVSYFVLIPALLLVGELLGYYFIRAISPFSLHRLPFSIFSFGFGFSGGITFIPSRFRLALLFSLFSPYFFSSFFPHSYLPFRVLLKQWA